MSTEILPVEPVQPEPAQSETVEARKPRRRGWIIAVIIVAIVVVLGIVAFVVAEALAKDYARGYVRDRIVEVLNLPDDAAVDVDLGGGSIILQALAGRVDQVDVDVPEVAFGELSGAVRLYAEGVPLDEMQPVDVLGVDFAIGADDLGALGQGAGAEGAPTFEFAEGEVLLSSEFSLFGATIPLSLSLEPSAADGDLVLTPTSITLGDETIESGDDDSFFGQLLSGLFQPQNLCIAASVPEALVLTDATIDDAELVLGFTGDGAAFGGPELSTPGTCPEG
ncbi:MAG: DUF2993 domain-containing protein [Pseudolysinimonas sp.]|jgi:hypothetical protein|uniref:LmeA family phospholipid-binding protein n=1 Tax=Pseudolysinimonas sp. TaxID=2680009 RepID=UPI003C724C00